MSARQFEITRAVRKAVGLLIGLVGPSGSGKTYSALELAEGIRRVAGGEIALVDTENKRALYYAERFQFNHVPFDAPFSPDDYLSVLEFCVKRGAKTIIVDSGSHEHEGPGGVLEWHDEETQRLASRYNSTPEKQQIAAWGPPKKARRNLINRVLQMNVNIIFTFRAKEKIKVVGGGKPPQALGWQPICGEEWMYEFALQALLLPGSEGRPTWQSELESERAIMKLPAQFSDIFDRNKPAQLSKDVGERLARWAAGDSIGDPVIAELLDAYSKVVNRSDLDELEKRRGGLWKTAKASDKTRLKDASEATAKRLASPPAFEPSIAIASLKAARSLEELGRAWDAIANTVADVPNDVETIYHDIKVQFEGAK